MANAHKTRVYVNLQLTETEARKLLALANTSKVFAHRANNGVGPLFEEGLTGIGLALETAGVSPIENYGYKVVDAG